MKICLQYYDQWKFSLSYIPDTTLRNCASLNQLKRLNLPNIWEQYYMYIDHCIFWRSDLFSINLIVSSLSQLLKNPQVLFAGYKMLHPLEHKFVLRIQTTPDYTPQEALTMAIQDLLTEVNVIETRFKVNTLTQVSAIPLLFILIHRRE